MKKLSERKYEEVVNQLMGDYSASTLKLAKKMFKLSDEEFKDLKERIKKVKAMGNPMNNNQRNLLLVILAAGAAYFIYQKTKRQTQIAQSTDYRETTNQNLYSPIAPVTGSTSSYNMVS